MILGRGKGLPNSQKANSTCVSGLLTRAAMRARQAGVPGIGRDSVPDDESDGLMAGWPLEGTYLTACLGGPVDYKRGGMENGEGGWSRDDDACGCQLVRRRVKISTRPFACDQQIRP